MMAITTSNSTRVKPYENRDWECPVFITKRFRLSSADMAHVLRGIGKVVTNENEILVNCYKIRRRLKSRSTASFSSKLLGVFDVGNFVNAAAAVTRQAFASDSSLFMGYPNVLRVFRQRHFSAIEHLERLAVAAMAEQIVDALNSIVTERVSRDFR